MIQEFKALLVVLSLGSLAFIFGKKVWLSAMSLADFKLRRNLWVALTVIAFLSPSFWIFFILAFPALLWAGRRDTNPLALYVVLFHIVPPFSIEIPMVGLNQLFPINVYRLLTLTILLPYAMRLLSSQDDSTNRTGRKLAYLLLTVFLLFQVAQLAPNDSVTNSVRRLFLGVLDSILLVYVFSRGIRSFEQVREILTSFAMMLAVMAPIAAFESVRGWLLFQSLAAKWDAPLMFAYLMRGDMLRAQVSTGHALAFGYLSAIAFATWLYITKNTEVKRPLIWLGGAWLWMGLIASYSRAPWLTAVLMMFIFTLMAPGRKGQVVKLIALSSLAVGAVMVLPIGEKIVSVLPFVGTVDAENVTYRQMLAEESWKVIQRFPVFGTPDALMYLEHMRQGEGIIDLVNVYASITLFHGFFGFALFFGYFLIALLAAYWAMKRDKRHSAQAVALGACLVTLLLGTHFFMATGSFGTGLAQMSWILSALALGYAGIRHRTPVAVKPEE